MQKNVTGYKTIVDLEYRRGKNQFAWLRIRCQRKESRSVYSYPSRLTCRSHFRDIIRVRFAPEPIRGIENPVPNPTNRFGMRRRKSCGFREDFESGPTWALLVVLLGFLFVLTGQILSV